MLWGGGHWLTCYGRIIKLGKDVKKKLNCGKTIITTVGVWTVKFSAVIDQQ